MLFEHSTWLDFYSFLPSVYIYTFIKGPRPGLGGGSNNNLRADGSATLYFVRGRCAWALLPRDSSLSLSLSLRKKRKNKASSYFSFLSQRQYYCFSIIFEIDLSDNCNWISRNISWRVEFLWIVVRLRYRFFRGTSILFYECFSSYLRVEQPAGETKSRDRCRRE